MNPSPLTRTAPEAVQFGKRRTVGGGSDLGWRSGGMSEVLSASTGYIASASMLSA